MGEIFYYFIEFILKCVFVYPVMAVWYGGKYILKVIENRDRPVATRDQSRPPTPTETAAAQTQLRVADALLSRYTETEQLDRATMEDTLSKATRAIMTARNLDPRATFAKTDKTGTATYGVDGLSALALYIEAEFLENRDHDTLFGDFVGQVQISRDRKRALEAANKLIVYKPRDAAAWRLKAMAHKNLKDKRPALAAIQKSIELDPTDPIALQILAALQ